MTEEETIKQTLEGQFAFLKEKVTIQRERRLWVELEKDQFFSVFDHAVKQMNFCWLPSITGMDEGTTFGVAYHLSRENGVMLNLKVHLSRENPVLQSVSSCFPSADGYERELIDLLGIKVEGLQPGPRYPLPDTWPEGQYPLRKDWKGISTLEGSTCEIKEKSNA
jgi:membrane-bound hydrogenase subunit beta